MTAPMTPRMTDIENARQRRQNEARAVSDLAGHSMDYHRLPRPLRAIVDAYRFADLAFIEASDASHSFDGVDGVTTEQWAMLTELERLAYHTRAELERHGVVEMALAWLASHPVGWDDEPDDQAEQVVCCNQACTGYGVPFADSEADHRGGEPGMLRCPRCHSIVENVAHLESMTGLPLNAWLSGSPAGTVQVKPEPEIQLPSWSSALVGRDQAERNPEAELAELRSEYRPEDDPRHQLDDHEIQARAEEQFEAQAWAETVAAVRRFVVANPAATYVDIMAEFDMSSEEAFAAINNDANG